MAAVSLWRVAHTRVDQAITRPARETDAATHGRARSRMWSPCASASRKPRNWLARRPDRRQHCPPRAATGCPFPTACAPYSPRRKQEIEQEVEPLPAGRAANAGNRDLRRPVHAHASAAAYIQPCAAHLASCPAHRAGWNAISTWAMTCPRQRRRPPEARPANPPELATPPQPVKPAAATDLQRPRQGQRKRRKPSRQQVPRQTAPAMQRPKWQLPRLPRTARPWQRRRPSRKNPWLSRRKSLKKR